MLIDQIDPPMFRHFAPPAERVAAGAARDGPPETSRGAALAAPGATGLLRCRASLGSKGAPQRSSR